MKELQLARTLGWFSIGLGLAELLTPRRISKTIGVKPHPGVLRVMGLREITSGIGILTQKKPTTWVWSRVIGDIMDLGMLGMAFGSSHAQRSRLAIATATVAGVAAVDLLCGKQLSRRYPEKKAKGEQGKIPLHKVITINRPAEELYRFWRNFENLPRVMGHLKSVTATNDKRSHWVAKGPMGHDVEWDAEVTQDVPNKLIAWRSLEGADVDNSGSVRFETATGGRGTVVRVQLSYNPPGGVVGAKVAKVMGQAPEKQIPVDLIRFKQLMETGEIAKTEGQSSGRRKSTSAKFDDLLRA
ncbi:MAG: SRPBCC family protein [Verrucomicrobiota bacterium]|nr:SRPBCC family protein [Verrucomicrobiota bacterium]